MKKTCFILVITVLMTIKSPAQQGTSLPSSPVKMRSNAVSAGINIPFEELSATHSAGIALNYSWSKNRLGKLMKRPNKRIAFIANGALDYYFGKKETVAGYPYKYGSYLFIHAFGGAICHFNKKYYTALTAGPAMGLYKGVADFSYGSLLDIGYYISERMAIAPGLLYMKTPEANALWTVQVKINYAF